VQDRTASPTGPANGVVSRRTDYGPITTEPETKMVRSFSLVGSDSPLGELVRFRACVTRRVILQQSGQRSRGTEALCLSHPIAIEIGGGVECYESCHVSVPQDNWDVDAWKL